MSDFLTSRLNLTAIAGLIAGVVGLANGSTPPTTETILPLVSTAGVLVLRLQDAKQKRKARVVVTDNR